MLRQWFLHESDAAVFSYLVNGEDDPCRWYGRAAELLALPTLNVSLVQRQKARSLLNIEQVRSTVSRAVRNHSGGGGSSSRPVFSTLVFGTYSTPLHSTPLNHNLRCREHDLGRAGAAHAVEPARHRPPR